MKNGKEKQGKTKILTGLPSLRYSRPIVSRKLMISSSVQHYFHQLSTTLTRNHPKHQRTRGKVPLLYWAPTPSDQARPIWIKSRRNITILLQSSFQHTVVDSPAGRLCCRQSEDRASESPIMAKEFTNSVPFALTSRFQINLMMLLLDTWQWLDREKELVRRPSHNRRRTILTSPPLPGLASQILLKPSLYLLEDDLSYCKSSAITRIFCKENTISLVDGYR